MTNKMKFIDESFFFSPVDKNLTNFVFHFYISNKTVWLPKHLDNEYLWIPNTCTLRLCSREFEWTHFLCRWNFDNHVSSRWTAMVVRGHLQSVFYISPFFIQVCTKHCWTRRCYSSKLYWSHHGYNRISSGSNFIY